MPVFKTGAFNRSATHPYGHFSADMPGRPQPARFVRDASGNSRRSRYTDMTDQSFSTPPEESPHSDLLLYCAMALLALGSALVLWTSKPVGGNLVDQARFVLLSAFIFSANAALALAYFGFLRTARVVLGSVVWVGISMFVVVTGLGLHSSVLFLYLPAILFTALVSSWSLAVLHTWATIVVLWSLWWAEETGRLPGISVFLERTTNFNFTIGVTAACLVTLILATVFEYMVSRAHRLLAQAHSEESAANQGLKLAASAARSYVWEWDVQSDRLTWLTPAHPLLGPRPSGGRYPPFRDMVHPDDRERYKAQSREFAASGDVYERDFRIVRTDGEVRWLHGRGRAFRDAQGKPLRLVGVTVDIDERKRHERQIEELTVQLETRVSARTTELEAAIKELESISYSVSHDMRTPLRAIHGYASLMKTEQAGMPADAANWLDHIGDNAARMGLMVDALVGLIRVLRVDLRKETLDMKQLASGVAEACAREHYQSVPVSVGNMPAACADRALISELMRQLIDNALKFSSKRETPTVRVGWDVEHAAWYVRDNGIGIDVEYVHKIWGLFERLHGPASYDGLGVGLAIAQRIVERHGGKIWVESALDGGTTFFFSLPAPEAQMPV